MRGKHRRKRPWWKHPVTLMLTAVVLVAAAAGGWWVTRSGSSTSPDAAPTTSSPSVTPSYGTTTLPPPTTSLGATSPGVTATGASGPPVSAPGSLTYALAAGTPIEVVASDPCWIEVRDVAGGPITRVTTLQAGQRLSLISPVWIRFGNAGNVHVSTGTAALQLPPGVGDLVIASA